MYKVILFAGTTEGRRIAEFLGENSIQTLVCTATGYGASLIIDNEYVTIEDRRLNAEDMTALFRESSPELIIDATHPYAQDVTKNIRNASNACNIEYMRVIRSGLDTDNVDGAIYVESVDEAIDYLMTVSGKIMVTTGSKEIAKYCAIDDYKERVIARVLSTAESIRICHDAGFEGKNLICMQGPFSREMNVALLRQFDCKYLVTKVGGKVGGYEEKIKACYEAGVTPVIVGIPTVEEGLSYDECISTLVDRFTINVLQYTSLIGIGMGDCQSITKEAEAAINEAQLVVGAGRMLDSFDLTGKAVLKEYYSNKICDYIKTHCEFRNVAVLLSGDCGFYSGAKKLVPLLEEAGCIVKQIPGISSVSYFYSKIKISWDDAIIVSNHGLGTSLIPLIRDNHKVFSILGKKDDISNLAKKLVKYNLHNVTMYVGEKLSYSDESVLSGKPIDLLNYENDPLCVVVIINKDWEKTRINKYRCRKDYEFIRGKVPMTKEEIRTLSIDRLGIEEDSVCYDVGAGTGSIAIDMAIKASQGAVYAIEKKPEAVDLIEENKIKFRTDNVNVISGLAPDAMKDLPVPTHVFIGGSSGNMEEIITSVRDKNPNVRIVINCIALESVGQAVACGHKFSDNPDIIQIQASRARTIGKYTMMNGENPITIVAFGGKES